MGCGGLTRSEIGSEAYEEKHMVPATTNKQLADVQLHGLLHNWSSKYRNPCKKIVTVLLGERLREAMMYPESPAIYRHIVNGALDGQRLILRHLALPRPEFVRNHWIKAGTDSRNRRYWLFNYLAHPWYVKPTIVRRWGPGAWITRLLSFELLGDDGDKYSPDGYTFAEIGPQSLSGNGVKEMEDTRARLVQQRRGGCPFSTQ